MPKDDFRNTSENISTITSAADRESLTQHIYIKMAHIPTFIIKFNLITSTKENALWFSSSQQTPEALDYVVNKPWSTTGF